VWLKVGSQIVTEHVSNEIGSVGFYSGDTPPTYVVPPAVSDQLIARIERLKQEAMEVIGVSQLSANSQKPAGLNSGKALREFSDIESERFYVIEEGYQQFYMDLAKLSIAVAKKIYEKEGKYEVKVPGRSFIKSIDWKDIDLEDDAFTMKCYPVSGFAKDPAQRMQDITDLMQAGIIRLQQGRRLIDYPDVQKDNALADAMEDLLTMVLDKMVDGEGETEDELDADYTPPDPIWDLAMAEKMATSYYIEGQLGGLSEPRLQLVRTFLQQIDAVKQAAQPPPAAPGAPGAPQAQPAPPPTSDMLPNAPGGAPAPA
jgi:hypothetical protein